MSLSVCLVELVFIWRLGVVTLVSSFKLLWGRLVAKSAQLANSFAVAVDVVVKSFVFSFSVFSFFLRLVANFKRRRKRLLFFSAEQQQQHLSC